ncbi:hypothetical protein AX16_006611, partial [Volvariella volvacea WC 439]
MLQADYKHLNNRYEALQEKYDALLLDRTRPSRSPIPSQWSTSKSPTIIDVKAIPNVLHIPEEKQQSILKRAFPNSSADNVKLDVKFSEKDFKGQITFWKHEQWGQHYEKLKGVNAKRQRKGDPTPALKRQYMQERDGDLVNGKTLDS